MSIFALKKALIRFAESDEQSRRLERDALDGSFSSFLKHRKSQLRSGSYVPSRGLNRAQSRLDKMHQNTIGQNSPADQDWRGTTRAIRLQLLKDISLSRRDKLKDPEHPRTKHYSAEVPSWKRQLRILSKVSKT